MDLFEFEIEQPEFDLYSSSLESQESIPEPQEAQTPLLYESRISSRNNSIAFHNDEDDCFIDQLDLSQDVIPAFELATKKTSLQYTTSPIIKSLEQNDVIEETIVKGSNALKMNYKKWLLSTSS